MFIKCQEIVVNMDDMDHGVSADFKHEIFAYESFQVVEQCIYLKVIESIRGEA